MTGQKSEFAFEVTAEPANLAPVAPAGLVAFRDRSGIALNWDDNRESDFKEYSIDRSEGERSEFRFIAVVRSSNYRDTTTSTHLSYRYRVTATDTAGNVSDYSRTAQVASDDPPTAPTGVRAQASGDAIALYWDEHRESDVVGYVVYRSDGGTFSRVAETLATAFLDVAVVLSVRYSYAITAIDAIGNESERSPFVDAQLVDFAPAAPTEIAVERSSSAIVLDWPDNPEDDVEKYIVHRATISGGPYEVVGESEASRFIDRNVEVDQTYVYVVTARDEGGNASEFSVEVIVPEREQAEPVVPPGSTTVTLLWDPPVRNEDGSALATPLSYRIHVGNEPGAYATLILAGETPHYTFREHPPGVYYCVVTAYDANGNESKASSELAVTIP